MTATYEDANLIVHIVQWGAEIGLDNALVKLHDKSFDPEKATLDDEHVRKVLNFGELVGTFVKQNVLDRGLVTDLWAMEGTWRKVAAAAKRARDEHGEPRLYENFEALARGVPAGAR